MRYVISHWDAFWLSYNLGAAKLAGIRRVGGFDLGDVASTSEELRGFDLSQLEELLRPPQGLVSGRASDGQAGGNGIKEMSAQTSRDVLVSASVGSRSSGRFARHRWEGAVPPDSLLDLGGGICAATPELCLVQLAGEVDDAQLIRMTMALCATYRIGASDWEKADPLTSVDKIGRFLEQCPGRHGAKKCRRLLSMAKDGSRSPKETELHLLLTLPAKMGGYALGGDELNYRVNFDDGDADILDRPDRRRAYVDVAWAKRMVGVEYQGKDHDDKVPEDRRRINLLTAKGWRMFQVDKEQLGDPARLDVTARQVAHWLKKPVPERTEVWKAARGELRETLLGPKNVRL